MTRIALTALILSAVLTSSLAADPIVPNIVANDFNFTYAGVSFDSASGELSGTGAATAFSFEPVLGGNTYPVFNLSDALGAAVSLQALFDQTASNAAVDGLFTTLGTSGADLVMTGKIPDLGVVPGGSYTGTLIEADVIALELFGDANASSLAFNGEFTILGGDLVTAGYVSVGQVLAMRSWLSGVSPSLPNAFAFDSDFSASGHVGELGTVPEPASLALGALALGAFAALRRRHRHA